MRHAANALLLVGTLWAAGAAHAQAPAQKAGGKTMEYRGMELPTDPKQFVQRMLYFEGEILKEAKLAQEKSRSPQVKEFSTTLTETHQRFSERLKQAAKEQKLQLGAFKPQGASEKNAASAEKSFKERIETLSGEAFDQPFLAAQVDDHDRLLLNVSAGQQLFNNQPLGAVLKEMQPELSQLRDRAYQLLGQQAASGGTGGAGTKPDDGKK